MIRVTQKALDGIANALMSCNFDAISEMFADTVSVFLLGGQYCTATRADMKARMGQLMITAHAEGVVNVRGELAAHGLCRNRKVKTFVDWHYEMANGAPERTTSVVLYWADRGFGPRIEMVEYLAMAFNSMPAWTETEDVPEVRESVAVGF